MSDANNVWPPPPSISPEPIPSPPDKPKAGIAALRCFATSVVLVIVWVLFCIAGIGDIVTHVIWLIAEASLSFAGVAHGMRGVRSWQGKCGLFGSMLMAIMVVSIVVAGIDAINKAD
ncbi:MAG: hypothetical protein ABIY70_10250 [Capsulimonas sp.]|uniref:hypothetical protein n=1 Tax=Capsulimonas sp. TaxID=2494211 RepID=UPI0032659BF6